MLKNRKIVPFIVDTSKVKVACYKDGVESIFYDNSDFFGLYDLILKEQIGNKCLISKTRKKFFDVIESKELQRNYMLVTELIEAYKKDRSKELSLDKVYIVTQLEEYRHPGIFSQRLINSSDINEPQRYLECQRFESEYLIYEDENGAWFLLETNERFYISNFSEQLDKYSSFTYSLKDKKPIKSIIEIDAQKLSKRDIIQKYREYKELQQLDFLKYCHKSIYDPKDNLVIIKDDYEEYEYQLKLARKMHENKNIS